MKMMIIGDAHFGVRNNAEQHLAYQEKWFEEELIPLVKEKEVEHVVFLGDVFDSRNSLSPLIIRSVRRLFKKLVDITEVHAIIGNHDIMFRNTKDVHSLVILEDQGVNVYTKPTELPFGDKKFLFLPWIVKDEMEEIRSYLAKNKFDVCFGHLEVNGFEMTLGVVEEKGFEKALFSNINKVYSGHFHLRRNDKNIQYTGTPYEMDWGDYQDQKGVTILDVDTLKEEFVPTKHTPKHIKIDDNTLDLADIDKDLIENNIVNMKFYDSDEIEQINYIEKINSLKPFYLSIDNDMAEEIDSDVDIETSIKDTLGFMKEFVLTVETPEGLEEDILMEKIKDLFEEAV